MSAVVTVDSAEITSGQRQHSAPPVLVMLLGMSLNKRRKMAAKAGKELFVGKRYMQRGPEQASQNHQTQCSEPAAQMPETKQSASTFWNVEDVYP